MSSTRIELGIEASTPICSVALRVEGRIYERWERGRGIHSEALFLMIESLFKEHSCSIFDVKSCLISIGPGSYTGLRIAASAVKGLFFDLPDVDVLGVNTMASFVSLSSTVVKEGVIHTLIDARRTHVYHQQWELSSSQLVPILPLDIRPIREVETLLKKGDFIGGTGAERFQPSALEGVHILKEAEVIRAGGLFHALDRWSDVPLIENPYFTKLDVDSFEPQYFNKGLPQVTQKG